MRIDNLMPVDLGKDGQELVDWILSEASDMEFVSNDQFNEGEWLEKAAKALGWAFCPQTGGLEIIWLDTSFRVLSETQFITNANTHNDVIATVHTVVDDEGYPINYGHFTDLADANDCAERMNSGNHHGDHVSNLSQSYASQVDV
ncbi:MAG: hypothetical protein GY941_21055 [Planctomycetes bacterium]|nr:hypothetical protein [Planctomycetota bacterium]